MGIVKDLLVLIFALIFSFLIVENDSSFLILIIPFSLIIFRCIYLHKKLIKQRKYFVETLNHDLKVSTLAQIRGLELLQKNGHSSELISDIQDSCKFTLEMISMLLNAYRYENGEEVLKYERFDFREVLQDVFVEIFNHAKDRGVNILSPNSQKMYLDADKTCIFKLMLSLLSTAIFNSDRNSEITVSVDKKTYNYEVSVEYWGTPLTEEECRRMFSNSPRFSTVGHGIRMFLCKKIIEFHGGTIRVSNNGGKRNSFTFVIPFSFNRIGAKSLSISTLQPFIS